MAGIKLSDFRAHATDVSRMNRFFVAFNGAYGIIDDDEYLAKSIAIPAREIGNCELDWQGQKMKLAGDPTIGDLTIGFWNKYNFNLRKKFQMWSTFVAGTVPNTRGRPVVMGGTNAYKCDKITVRTLDGIGAETNKWIYKDCFPTSVAEIGLDMGSADTPEEYDVTFSVEQTGNPSVVTGMNS